MTPSRKSLTLYMVITAVGEAGTMTMGVLKRLSERRDRREEVEEGRVEEARKGRWEMEVVEREMGKGRREKGGRRGKWEGEMEGEKWSEVRWEVDENSIY